MENEYILKEIKALPRTTWKLDLSYRSFTSLKGVVFPEHLKTLHLEGTQLLSLEGIFFPQGLQRLYLCSTPLTDLHDAMLPDGLEMLNLNGAVQLTDLKDITFPRGLKILNLGCTSIKSLKDTTLPDGLQTLSMRESSIETLLGVVFPESLEELYLNGSPLWSVSGVKFPKSLKHLDLSYTYLHSFLGVTLPSGLCELSLSGTDIKNMNDIHFPATIKKLWLDNTGLSCVPDSVRKLTNLEILDLSGLSLKELPTWLPVLGLPFTREKYANGIRFHNTTVEGVDMSIFDQSQEAILQWFEERKRAREEAATPLNEVKVVFLGDGGAGKSHTIARLLKDGVQTKDFPNISTPGIVITDKTYPIGDREVKVHYWDFGGQEILHSMHRMFLTERTLYVLVLNVRDGTQNDRARYWLYNLRSFANGAPVLLVLNQMDMNENASLNESDLRKLYPKLAEQVVRLSTLRYSDEEFEQRFIDVLRRQIGSMEILAFPFTAAWSRLKEKLQNMEENYIFGDVFQSFCEECGVRGSDAVRRDLLNWFSDLGVSFCYSGSASLEDYVVLRPDWITNAIYIVLFNKVEASQNGQVSHEVIYRMLSSKDAEKYRRTVTTATYKPHEVDYVLKVFRKFRLSFLAEDGVEFLPMLCDENAAPISDAYEQDSDVLEFRMNYEYLPDNVIHRLMVERRRELQLSHVWKYGGLFVNDCTGLSAVVKTEGNLLRIMVRREDSQCQPQLYLNALKQDIERFNAEMGLTSLGTDVAYKHGGSVEYFDYAVLLASLEAGLSHVVSLKTKKPVLIQDILKQSGHSVDKAQDKLLTDIVHACEMLQDDRSTWDKSEDDRTTYIRNLLRSQKYIANDQSRGGVSAGGERAGELDLDIRLEPDVRWTIFEALNLSGSSESRLKYWDAHLDKLLDNYNSTGCPFLFHVTYLSCSKDSFMKHCIAFEEHIRWYAPAKFSVTSRRPTDPMTRLGLHQGGFRRVMESVYDCGGIPMTVYHFFVRIGE